MRITITFCDQTEHERRCHEHCYSCFSRSEAEPLPHFIEFEMSPVFNHEYFCGAFASNRVLASSLAPGQSVASHLLFYLHGGIPSRIHTAVVNARGAQVSR